MGIFAGLVVGSLFFGLAEKSHAQATTIAITNHDFETGGLSDNSNSAFPGVIPAGWQAVPGAAPVGDFYGYYNPVDDPGGYVSGVSGSPGVTGTMAGPNVFYFGTAVDGQGIQQTLATTFALNTDYTLTVARGTRNSIFNNSLRMLLYAGSTVLASRDVAPEPAGSRGTFLDYSVTYTANITNSSANVGLVGQPLVIRFLEIDNPGNPQAEVDIDNVRLTSSGADTDGDGLSDAREALLGTDPNKADTDGDGLNDNVETGTGIFVAAPGGAERPVTFTIVTNKITDGQAGTTSLVSTNGGSMSGKIMYGAVEAGEWFLSDFRFVRKANSAAMTLAGANFASSGTTTTNPYGRAGVGVDMGNGGTEPSGIMKFSYNVQVSMKPGYRASNIFFLGKNPAVNRSYGPQSNNVVGSIQATGFAGTGTVRNPSNNLVTPDGTTFSSGQLLSAYYAPTPATQNSGAGDYSGNAIAWALEVPAADPVGFLVDFTAGTRSAASEGTAFSVQVFQEDTGTSPLLADSDNDGLTDSEEITIGTNPNLADTDGDGVNDGTEVTAGTFPLSYVVGSNGANSNNATVFSGTNDLVKIGSNEVTLTAVNSYSGGTFIASGTLALNGSGTAGSGEIKNQSVLRLNSYTANSSTLTNLISGTGSLWAVVNGNNKLTAANSYGGVTRVDSSSSGSRANFILSNSTGPALYYGTNGQIVIGNSVYVQTMANNQLGTNVSVRWNVTNNANYGYFLLMGRDQTVGNLDPGTDAARAVIENTESETGVGNATLTIHQTSDVVFSGYIRNTSTGSGTLGLTKNGSGKLTVAGANITYTGATTIEEGTLVLSNATSFASPITVNSNGIVEVLTGTAIANNITNNGILVFNRSDDFTNSYAISGTGEVKQISKGTTTLTGTHTYTGPTTISDGVLFVKSGGSINSSTNTVQSGGVLWVNGSVGAVTVESGAKVKGSGAVASLRVNSNGLVKITATNTWNTAGPITLDSGSKIDVADLTLTQQPYVLLSGTSLTGTPTLVGTSGFNVTNTSNTIQLVPTLDSDNDGLTDYQESQLGSNPNLADTDGDGFSDADEVAWGMDPNARQSTVYDFNSLNFGNLNNQDAWKTSIYGSGGDAQVTNWAKNNSKAIQYAGSGGGFGVSATRTNNATFRFPRQGKGRALVEFDTSLNWWGVYVAMGVDADGDGTFTPTGQTNNFANTTGEHGWNLFLQPASSGLLQLKSGGNGTTNTATNALISFGGNVRLRIVFNYDTNGGAGSASVFLKNLDVANAPFQAVSGLQNINLGLVPTATDARNPKLWNAVGFHIEGATGVLDNFSLDHDTDGDGLADSIENNSRNFLAGTNPGTSPALADTDGDGLNDGVETGTGVFVSATNTGTNPNLADTDGDGLNDGAEVAAGTDPNEPFDRPAQLASGASHTLYIPVIGGRVLAWGANSVGQCGPGYTSTNPVLSGVPVVDTNGAILSNAVAAAAGAQHSLILAGDRVHSAGTNPAGQLGLGTNVAATNRFTPIPGLTNIRSVVSGDAFALARDGDGRIWAWGFNGFGQLGNGNLNSQFQPQPIGGANRFSFVAAGAEHAVALDTNGVLHTWGRGNYGQLGLGGVQRTNVPSALTLSFTNATNKVIQAGAGLAQTFVLTEEGEVWAFGRNDLGQLGLGTNVILTNVPTRISNAISANGASVALPEIRRLSVGPRRVMAIARNGTVYGWGYNRFGELGLAPSTNAPLYCEYLPTEVPALYGSLEIAGGAYQTFALDSSGTLLAIGFNEGGQLGIGSTNPVSGGPAPTTEAGKSSQTIIFNRTNVVGAITVGGSVLLTGTASSTLPLVYTVSDTNLASVSSNIVTFRSLGNLAITARQPGNTNFNAASPVTVSNLVIAKATPSVTWTNPAPITYGTALSATQLNATSSVAGTFTYSPALGATVAAGTNTLTAVFTADDPTNYVSPLTNTVSLVVNKSTPTITAPSASAITYGQTLGDSALTGGSASVPGSFAWTAPATVPTASGSYSVTFTPTDTANYSTVTTSVSVTVNPAPQTITFNLANSVDYSSGGTLALSATGGGSGNSVTFSSTDPSVAAVSGSTLFLLKPGTVTITANQQGNSNYQVASAVSRNLTIRAPQNVTLESSATTLTYGQSLDLTSRVNEILIRDNAVNQAIADYNPVGLMRTNNISGFSALRPYQVEVQLNIEGTGYGAVLGDYYAYLRHTTADGLASQTVELLNRLGTSVSDPTGSLADGINAVFSSESGADLATAPDPISGPLTGTYRASGLSVLGGMDPNGTWTLFVEDQSSGGTGNLVSWELRLTEVPMPGSTGPSGVTYEVTEGASLVNLSGARVTALSGTGTVKIRALAAATSAYAAGVAEIEITLQKAPVTISSAPTASDITSGQELSSSGLSGGWAVSGTTPVAGTFAWSNPSIEPLATSSHEVTFTPMESDNYATAAISVLVTVGSGTGDGGGGMGPASVPDAAAAAQPGLALTSGLGGITTQSVGKSSGSTVMLFSYNRPEGGSYVNERYIVGGLQYEVQQSANLGSWGAASVEEIGSVPLENGWERVTVRVAAAGDKAFLRLKVSD